MGIQRYSAHPTFGLYGDADGSLGDERLASMPVSWLGLKRSQREAYEAQFHAALLDWAASHGATDFLAFYANDKAAEAAGLALHAADNGRTVMGSLSDSAPSDVLNTAPRSICVSSSDGMAIEIEDHRTAARVEIDVDAARSLEAALEPIVIAVFADEGNPLRGWVTRGVSAVMGTVVVFACFFVARHLAGEPWSYGIAIGLVVAAAVIAVSLPRRILDPKL